MKDKTKQAKMLTERQEQFLAEHHYLVENFLRYRNLPMDEFYDVVIFRFLRAVQQYDEREDLQQYAFSTIANNAMRSALSNHFAKEKRRNKKVQILSLDYQFKDSGLTLGDVIEDESVNVCESVCEKLSRPITRKRLLHRTPYKSANIYAFEKEAA
ncbi:MAG: hypothetical protein HFE51_09885 [Clostridia bacterium]|nr:hypothetical protein [Clostridia bacterium]MCI8979428.1 hypothetical protein [Clostridia bacterium]MCI9086712.1 hypothetical protein [Clostridia bacterium]NDO20315.1 hypothetical protein [Lachnospiraceae bacterium MD329]